MILPVRKQILEALDIVAEKGATRDEIIDLIGGGVTKRSVGMSLLRCSQDDLVIEESGRFYLKAIQPRAAVSRTKAVIEPFSNGRIELPAIAKGRSAKHVSVYTSPTEETNIVQVQMCINNTWIKIPLFANLKICTGPDIPFWSKYQETNHNVSVIRLIRANGAYTDIQVSRGYPVTMDYEETTE